MKTRLAVLAAALLLCAPAAAHVVDDQPYLVVDTDAGLDDVVALALALQHGRVELGAVVVTPGAAGPQKGVAHVGRLLHRFNRSDVALYRGVGAKDAAAPPFRGSAEALVGRLLPEEAPDRSRGLSPDAYRRRKVKVTVLVLGPLTSLAAALDREPGLADGIEEVLVAGPADPERNFNLAFDRKAFATLRGSGLHVEFVRPSAGAEKPAAWGREPFRPGRGTTVAETFLRGLFADEPVRRHYLERFPRFHDEAALLYYLDSAAFRETGEARVFEPKEGPAALAQFRELVVRGRHAKRRVVLADGSLPAAIFRDDVRERRDAILRKNGEDEWFAQLLMNEIHEHLGAYSVIGVKMGIRAAEVLNAPPHGMEVVSRSAAGTPYSCLNDGIIVGTGCTPGRGLFTHAPGSPDSVSAVFEYNGRRAVLTLREEWRAKVGKRIRGLVKEYGLEDERYWREVRRFGLDVWEDWHRAEVFRIETSN